MLFYVTSRYVTLWYVIRYMLYLMLNVNLPYAMLCYATLCSAMLMLCYVVLCYVRVNTVYCVLYCSIVYYVEFTVTNWHSHFNEYEIRNVNTKQEANTLLFNPFNQPLMH